MPSLSLIQAIVLLDHGERLHRKEGNGRFVRNAENIAHAKEIAFRILGRNLERMPRETQILFLLIEQMRERACELRNIEFSVYRFTQKEVRVATGWSNKDIRDHLAILENTGYVAMNDRQYRILLSSQGVNQLESRIRVLQSV